MKYSLFDPTKNMTILVETPVPVESQPFVASSLMEREPAAEQVGFVSLGDADCDIALRMAGGEFCGNASMSAAALYCIDRGLESARVSVRCSGAEEMVVVAVEKQGDGSFSCRAGMPKVKSIEERELYLGEELCRLPLVRLDGIAHIVMERPMERSDAEKAVKLWCHQLGADALGLMLLSPDRKCLTPLVYVPAADTLFWESSCASGTVAVGAYLAEREKAAQNLSFSEPGGTLSVMAEVDGRVCLQGMVCLEKRCDTTSCE